MSQILERELTTLEYVVLGLISIEPQSGYSIISFLEQGIYRWSASPGSIYPILKRLEKQGVIAGELEAVHETRPRKMYRLTSIGEDLLDEWITMPFSASELLEDRDVVMLKFLFAEKRFPREAVLDWLSEYEESTNTYDVTRRPFFDLTHQQASPHQKLILDGIMMELNMQREWIKMARQRLSETGENES